MILALNRDSSHRCSYLICLDALINQAKLLRTAKVKPGTYAGELITDLHDGIFRRSIELKRDYAEYYSAEYATFAEYVHKRFRFAPEMVRLASEQFSSSRQIIYFHPSHCFLEDDYGREFLEKLLEPRRKK